ncbi:MAG: class I SAM-dependent methyltransferase [Bacillota bacterium]
MGLDWYNAIAARHGGYLRTWDSEFDGPDGEAAFTDWLRRTIRSHPRVLDVGCGDGLYTLVMSSLAEHITGVDYAENMIRLAERHRREAAVANADFVCTGGRVEVYPFPDRSFDLIYSRRGPTSHLVDARRMLKPGGLVAGIHSGERERVLERLTVNGYEVLTNDEYAGTEHLKTELDLARWLSRTPGAPDFTTPEMADELERAAGTYSHSDKGITVPHWRFIWVARWNG